MDEHGGASDGEAADAVVERLYRECSRQLLVAAYALTGDLAEAEDAVQEAFVRAFARPGQVARADNPVAWMRIVTLNIARSRFRRKQRLNVLLRRVPAPDTEVPAADPDRIVLVETVRRLPMAQREVIALFYLADLSLEDVARTLKVSVNVVKSRLHRGRQALARLMREQGVDIGEGGAVRPRRPVGAVAGQRLDAVLVEGAGP